MKVAELQQQEGSLQHKLDKASEDKSLLESNISELVFAAQRGRADLAETSNQVAEKVAEIERNGLTLKQAKADADTQTAKYLSAGAEAKDLIESLSNDIQNLEAKNGKLKVEFEEGKAVAVDSESALAQTREKLAKIVEQREEQCISALRVSQLESEANEVTQQQLVVINAKLESLSKENTDIEKRLGEYQQDETKLESRKVPRFPF